MAMTPEAKRQVEAQKAYWAKQVAERQARESTQANQYRANAPIPLYGIGKGMEVYYAPGQQPGAARTQANGREVSGYWDPRTSKYVPANWTRPTTGNWINEGGRSYYGGDPPDFMLPSYRNDGSMTAAERAKDLEAMRRNPGGQGVVPGYRSGNSAPPAGWTPPSTLRGGAPPGMTPNPNPLPGNGQLPGGPPSAGQFVGTPGGFAMPQAGQGGAQPPEWFKQIQQQAAQAQALRGAQ